MQVSAGTIFYPHQLEEMTEELKHGDKVNENAMERENRAAAIIHRKRLQQQATLLATDVDL
jgi:hypothetical protein